ncbi:MAG: transposase [Firmicutes bacterium]|jgi:hypothetical protein|nr:transposase [Bacillota bacterium]
MLGKKNNQMTFADIDFGKRIPKDSYWHKLRTWGLEYLNEDIFAPLFSEYGRPSISPIYTFLSMLVQLEKGYSDRELEEESRFDDRVKYAITASRNFDGIDAVTLHDHRKRMFGNKIGLEIMAKTIKDAKKAGLFSEENLHVVDAFMVFGAASKMDVYTLIYQGIKTVLRFSKFSEMEEQAKAVLKRDDYDAKQRRPKINWDDPQDKILVLESLYNDAMALINFFSSFQIPEDLKCVVDRLEKIIEQNVKRDKDGRIEVVRDVSNDRIISTTDPDMRHGRKNKFSKGNGYKCSILTGGQKAGLVMGVSVIPANVPEGEHLEPLLKEAVGKGYEIKELYGDSAFSVWEVIEKYEGIDFVTKVVDSMNPDGLYTKDDFVIDPVEGTVRCPEGYEMKYDVELTRQRKETKVLFPRRYCGSCPQKERCTKSKRGRQITIHPYEDRLQQQRQYQRTQEFRERYAKRSHGERTIAHLTRHGARKARYRGQKKVLWQMVMAAINNNVKVLMGHKLHSVWAT